MENIIKIEELRIGNYICVNNNGHPCRVTELTTMSCTVESIKENNKEPYVKTMNSIPLTEEWLLKLGFEYKENLKWYSIDGMYIRKDGDEFETEIGECLYKTIDYVHQLQNLYFAHNDEELTMK
jgi:hypothetical protein